MPFPNKKRDVLMIDNRLYLLGIWQASWNFHIHGGRRPLAMGAVVPASDLLALLEQDDVKAVRQAHKDYWAAQNSAKLD